MNDNPQNFLMTPDERKVCKQIAATGESPHSLRAQALLSLDTGASQEEAAAQSGLTPSQVKYWAGRFSNNRLTIFPDVLITVTPEVNTAPGKEGEAAEAAVVLAKSKTKPKKEKKGKKGKKKKSARKKDNKKRDKKGKNSKKGRK